MHGKFNRLLSNILNDNKHGNGNTYRFNNDLTHDDKMPDTVSLKSSLYLGFPLLAFSGAELLKESNTN